MNMKKLWLGVLSAALVVGAMSFTAMADEEKGTKTNPYTLDEFNALSTVSGEVWVDVGDLDVSGESTTLGSYNLSDGYVWVSNGDAAPAGYDATDRSNAQNTATAYVSKKDGVDLHVIGSIISTAGADTINSQYGTLYFKLPTASTVTLEGMTISGVYDFNGSYTYLYNWPDGSLADKTGNNPAPWGTNIWYGYPLSLEKITLKECEVTGSWFHNGKSFKNVEILDTKFFDFENSDHANNSNPIWWQNVKGMDSFTMTGSTATATRPFKFESGNAQGLKVTYSGNTFNMLPGDKYTGKDSDKKKSAPIYFDLQNAGDGEITNNKLNADESHTQLIVFTRGTSGTEKNPFLTDEATFTVSGNTKGDGTALTPTEVVNDWKVEDGAAWTNTVGTFLNDGGVDATAQIKAAKIGTTEYETLAKALAAVKKNDTVELLDDITLTGAAKLSDAGLQGFTLDGKGHTISYKFGNGVHTSRDFIGTTAISFGNDAARKYIAGDITVKDLKMVGEGRFGFFLCGGSKNVLFENVEISGNYYYYPINCYGTSGATFKNCTVTNSYNNGAENEWGASVWSNVSDATHITVIDSKITAIAINKYTTANPLVPKITVKGNSETEIRTYDDGAVSGTRLMCLDAGSDVLVSVKAVEGNALTEIKPVAKIGNVLYESLKDAMQAACNMNVQNLNGIPTQTASVKIDLVNDVTIAEGISVRGGSVSTYGQHYVHNIDITLDGHNHKIITGVSHSDIDGPTRTPSVGFASSNGKFTVQNVIAPDDLLFAVSRPGDAVSQCGHGTPLCAPATSLLVEGCTFHGSNVGYLSGVETVTYRNNQFLLTENANDNADAYPIWYKFDYALPATFTFEGNTVISQRPVQIGRLASTMGVNVKNNNFTVANEESAAKAGALMLADIDGYVGDVTLTGNTVDADSAIILYNPSDNNTNFDLEVKDNTLRNGTKLLGYNSWSGSYNDPAKVADAEEKLENLLKQTAAETVELAFEKVSDSVYNIVVRGKGGRYINRLTAVDLTFAIDNSDIAYAISPADKVTLTEENGRYLFNFDGVNAADASGSGIVIGKVEFTGFGSFKFNATAGVANTTKFADNIVDTFVSDAATEKGRFDITNADASIDTTLAPATHKLTVNITFPNAIADQKAAYQDMKVVISGGDLAENLVYKLGTDGAIALEGGAYKLVVDGKLTENTAYTVTVSGAGYRTARYTVTMTADKTLNFWNNVKDTPAVVEEGKDASKKSVTFLAGDIVKDGKINIYDLSAVVSYFGESGLSVENHPEYAKYDLNRDGKIDSKDVAYVLVSWGK